VDQKLDGAPSVLYDAVALLLTSEGAQALSELPPARDFVSDAFAHSKFVGYQAGAAELFAATGLAEKLDGGFFDLSQTSPEEFLDACGQLRFWERFS
jgi:catalase